MTTPSRIDSEKRTLDERALDFLEKHRATRVEDLYNSLRSEVPKLTEKEVTNLVWRLADEGKVDLTQVRPNSLSLRELLHHWELHLAFYISLLISLAAILTVYVIPSTLPFVVCRWIIGSTFVLFVPGYVAVEGFFGFAQLDMVERITLSVGLSVALTMFVGLLLNYTPWGITLTPVVLTLTAVTLLLDIVALFARSDLGRR